MLICLIGFTVDSSSPRYGYTTDTFTPLPVGLPDSPHLLPAPVVVVACHGCAGLHLDYDLPDLASYGSCYDLLVGFTLLIYVVTFIYRTDSVPHYGRLPFAFTIWFFPLLNVPAFPFALRVYHNDVDYSGHYRAR